MNRDEIKAVYDRGPEAVIDLVESLFAIIAQQQQQILSLTQRVNELESRLKTDSHNSNKPPSSDLSRKKSRSLRHSKGKKSGAQSGHDPHFLRPVDTPNRIVIHPLTQCSVCEASLEDVEVSDYHSRQVFDLPPIKLEVTEHRVEVKQCRVCQTRCCANFPQSVSNLTQYGEGIKSLAVYLMTSQLLPYRRTRQIIEDLLGQSVSEGTLQSALRECFDSVGQIEESIRQAITNARLAHFDDTGFYVSGQRQWLHVASTSTLSYYHHHPKRGRGAIEEIGILACFQGTACHDSFRSYLSYQCKHALCNAHHLRELTYLEEEGHKWAGEMKSLLVEIKESVEEAIGRGEERLDGAKKEEFERRYEKILKKGLRVESRKPKLASGKRGPKKQSKAKNLLDRLSRLRKETLSFMYDFGVPFDNNQAERDLRMMKVKQKISGGFRREEGARIFCRIRGYISTMSKQGHNVLTALKSVFAGQPILPALSG